MVMDDMTVSVPVEKVDEVGMRWPISGEDVEDLFDVLKKRTFESHQTGVAGSRTTKRNSSLVTSIRLQRSLETLLYEIEKKVFQQERKASITRQ